MFSLPVSHMAARDMRACSGVEDRVEELGEYASLHVKSTSTCKHVKRRIRSEKEEPGTPPVA